MLMCQQIHYLQQWKYNISECVCQNNERYMKKTCDFCEPRLRKLAKLTSELVSVYGILSLNDSGGE